MAKVRWATVRHPPGRSNSLLRRLSAKRKRNSDLSAIGENFGGENEASAGGPDTRPEEDRSTEQSRTVYVNTHVDPHDLDEDGSPAVDYPRNKVRTARYTPFTFIPKNLYFQFQNVANLYFLLLVILQARHSPLPARSQKLTIPLVFLHFRSCKCGSVCGPSDHHRGDYCHQGCHRRLATYGTR